MNVIGMDLMWRSVLNIGVVEELPLSEVKSVRLANGITTFVMILALLSVIVNVLLKSWFFISALGVAILLLLLTYYLNFKKIHVWAKINSILVITGLLLFMSLKGGYGSGLEYYFLSLMALPFFFFRQKGLIYLFEFIFILSLLTQKFYSFFNPIETSSLPHMVFYVFNCIGSSALIILVVIFFKNLTLKNELDLVDKNAIIEKKNRQLTDINKQLDMFTYSVSHDLKAPLRIVDGYINILEKHNAFSGEDRTLFSSIKSNVSEMKELIESLLVFSHSVKKKLNIADVNLQEIVEDILNCYKEDIERYGVKIVLDPVLSIKADAILMKHVFDNLISNAIKYSHKKGQPIVEIGSYTAAGENVYYVKDNGAGFDMEYVNKLFIPFQRLHSRDDFEGSGVGLSIVKNVINRLGGKIWVNAKEGEGAEFYFSLPRQEK